MRVGINALYLVPGDVGGSEVYLRNVLPILVAQNPGDEFVLFANVENHGTFGVRDDNYIENRCPVRADRRPVRICWEQLCLAKKASAAQVDLLWNPGLTSPLRFHRTSVATIYDLQHVYLPGDFTPLSRLVTRTLISRTAGKAKRIITLSERSRQDIINHYGRDPSDVVTVPLAAADMFRPRDAEELAEFRSRHSLPEEYWLSIANSLPHKNLTRLLQAYRLVRERTGSSIPLVLMGMVGRLHEELRQEVSSLGLADQVRFTHWISFEELPYYYAASELFLFPSLFEGFGLPVLEALACGVPVVCSNASALPEVGGDAVLYFDPHSVEDLAGQIQKAATDKSLCSDLRRRGLEQSRRFSWSRTAEQTARVFREAVA